jgi:hypothetical protein
MKEVVLCKINYAQIGVIYMEEIIAKSLGPAGQVFMYVDITMANASKI